MKSKQKIWLSSICISVLMFLIGAVCCIKAHHVDYLYRFAPVEILNGEKNADFGIYTKDWLYPCNNGKAQCIREGHNADVTKKLRLADKNPVAAAEETVYTDFSVKKLKEIYSLYYNLAWTACVCGVILAILAIFAMLNKRELHIGVSKELSASLKPLWIEAKACIKVSLICMLGAVVLMLLFGYMAFIQACAAFIICALIFIVRAVVILLTKKKSWNPGWYWFVWLMSAAILFTKLGLIGVVFAIPFISVAFYMLKHAKGTADS